MKKHYKDFGLKYPTSSLAHKRLEGFRQKNLKIAVNNPNENWMKDILKKSGLKWKRQARWGYRIFDFWCHEIGVAIEVDGNEHRKQWDDLRDEANLKVSGILVIHVRNRNEKDAQIALERIIKVGTWNDRRGKYGLKMIRTNFI